MEHKMPSATRLRLLPRVPATRWNNHPGTQNSLLYRKQTNADHRRELMELLSLLLVHLRKYGHGFDVMLLMSAVLHHDDGEDFGLGDTLLVHKTDSRDVLEYLAFRDNVKSCVTCAEWKHLQAAFLLQFVGKHADSEVFPEEDREVMRALSVSRLGEVLVFEFLERIDYLITASQQFEEYGNHVFVREVLPNNAKRLDELVEEFPPLFGFYWPEPLKPWGEDLIAKYGAVTISRT